MLRAKYELWERKDYSLAIILLAVALEAEVWAFTIKWKFKVPLTMPGDVVRASEDYKKSQFSKGVSFKGKTKRLLEDVDPKLAAPLIAQIPVVHEKVMQARNKIVHYGQAAGQAEAELAWKVANEFFQGIVEVDVAIQKDRLTAMMVP